ncbi:lysozyme [Paraburkholderia aspalathi]|nr:lysozyme [Paraburkholderia aspalathi]
MKTTEYGRKLIEQREGVRLTAYQDSVGIWTIGAGHTSAAGAPKVTKGMAITAAEAAAILSRDLAIFESAVSSAVKVTLNQNEFDALVSLAFNIGAGAFKSSTLLKKLNAGDRAGAADQFLVWNKVTVDGKKVELKGLNTRRQAERKQFMTSMSVTSSNPPADSASSTTLASLIASFLQAITSWFERKPR